MAGTFDIISNPIFTTTVSQNWWLIRTGDKVYQLTMVDNFSVSASSTISSHKVEDKTVIADNVVNNNRKVTISGLISSIERLDATVYNTPKEFIESLEEHRKAGDFFTIEQDNTLNPIKDCLIESLSYTKGNKEGLTSWSVDLTFKEARVTSSATKTLVARPVTKPKTDPTENVGSGSSKVETLTTTISAEALNFFGGG